MLAIQPTNMTIAEYCGAMERKDIIVNKTYQRSDKVWPDSARSFLIESVLLGYPVPKIYLHSKTDLKTRRTIKEIVDGQQRSKAIFDFFNDNFNLSYKLETKEVCGMSYSELPEEWQSRFVSYSISIDLLVAATYDEVRQIFRRMNSYTIPLNPEELRNAEFQGPFKWFLYETARKYEIGLSEMGIFSEKALIRMQDLKLFTEIAYAIDNGITTTSKVDLDRIYRKYDVKFDEETQFSQLFDNAFDFICDLEFLSKTSLAKPHIIYSLALAAIHTLRPLPNLAPVAGISVNRLNPRQLELQLSEMAEALELDESEVRNSPYKDFVGAASERTNVKSQREGRVKWFLDVFRRALT